MNTKLLTLVIPCFNEEEMVPLFINEVEKVMMDISELDYEYVFVDDGSNDQTLFVLKEQALANKRVHYLSFSRNFGKEAALFAGLKKAKGNYVAVMDVDLQDPPELLIEMFNTIKTGQYDSIGTRRSTRDGEPLIRSFFARQFYKLINRISNTEIVDGARDYRMMKRQMVDAILEMSEYNRFSKGIFSWVGFKTKYLEFENKERVAGKTSWSFWSLFKYSIDGIVAFSEVPLAIASIAGFLTFAASIILAIFFAIRTLIFGNPTSGWTSLITIILGLGGIQLLSLGILGKYVGKIFLEVKNRPVFIIKETDEDIYKDEEFI